MLFRVKSTERGRVLSVEELHMSTTGGDHPGHTEPSVEEKLAQLRELILPNGHPNINALWMIAKDIQNISLTQKFFGYDLAKRLADALPVRQGLAPSHVGLKSKPSTQADLESDWAAYWAGELKFALVFHRKLWEFVFFLQALYEADLLRPGLKALGFGCGEEPLPSYFASRGIDVTVTDLAPEAQTHQGWANTNQHTATLQSAFKSDLIDQATFEKNVHLRWVDMNAIPTDLRGFDFCWSICSLEHVGSIAKGLDFIENSVETLRPGGLAVHTTEFNFMDDEKTIDNWATVLFQRRHFEAIRDRLEAKGHKVAPLDFDVGSKPLDKFIDVPPFLHDMPPHMQRQWGADHNHMKLSIDGFASTCFGIIVRKRS